MPAPVQARKPYPRAVVALVMITFAGLAMWAVLSVATASFALIRSLWESRRTESFVREVMDRRLAEYKGKPYIRRKTLIVVEETDTGEQRWRSNPYGVRTPLGDYLAAGIDDGVQTVVVLTCHWITLGRYSNGGSAEKHVCAGAITDIANRSAILKVGDFEVSGSDPPELISRPKGSETGGRGGRAYEAALSWLAKLDRR